jgi:hypothetical protein
LMYRAFRGRYIYESRNTTFRTQFTFSFGGTLPIVNPVEYAIVLL